MPTYSSLTSLVLAVLILWKSSCVWMHAIVRWSLWILSSGSDVIPDMSWIPKNQTFVDCPYKSVRLIYPWSEHLLLISPIGNHNFFELKRWIIRMLLSSDAFAWFLPLVEYRYSYQIPCGPPDPSVDYCSTDFAYSETFEFFMWYELTLVSQILYFNFRSLLPKMYPLTSDVLVLIR